MSEKHLSTQFDAELSGISTRVLEMGGMVESQVARAIYALTHSPRPDLDFGRCAADGADQRPHPVGIGGL